MGVINFTAGTKKTGGQDFSYLIDRLEIKKNQLEADGKLTAGDYQILEEMAQEIYAHPGLSEANRSNLDVKMSNYQSEAEKIKLKDAGDIPRINREGDDDHATLTMLAGNNPAIFLEGKAESLRNKASTLADSIDQAQVSGADYTNHLSEYKKTIQQLEDIQQAQSDAAAYVPGQANPNSDFVAYVTTNSRGEIQDMNIERTGSKTGYLETNAVMSGFQVYGKVNKKENNSNVFRLGNETFTAPDLLTPGPDGSMRAPLLVASSQQQGGAAFQTAQNGQFVEVDPNTVRTNDTFEEGDWLKGQSGFLYQKQADGSYKKNVNVTEEQVGATNVMRIPKVMEDGLASSVTETIDPTMIAPEQEQAPIDTMGPVAPTAPTSAAYPTSGPQSKEVAAGTSRTSGPMSRAPKSAAGVAENTQSGARGFLSRLFGG